MTIGGDRRGRVGAGGEGAGKGVVDDHYCYRAEYHCGHLHRSHDRHEVGVGVGGHA